MSGAGSIPFGSSAGGSPPATSFDVFDYPTGTLGTILAEPFVTAVGDVYAESGNLVVAGFTGQSEIYIDQPVSEQFTLEWVGTMVSLPTDFSKLSEEFLFVGAVDLGGIAAGFYFSRAGIAYTPCLGGGVQFLADSASVLTESASLTFRVAADRLSGNVYFYITPTADLARIGHQLKFVLPAIPVERCPTTVLEGVVLAASTSTRPIGEVFSSLSLSTAFLVPNLRPVADAGTDQAVRTCNVIQLNGAKSFDPEGAPLLYGWRLIEAPDNSQYVFVDVDGATPALASPPGSIFTDKLYAVSLGVVTVPTGAVLLVRGVAYTITGSGTDAFGNYVRVERAGIPVGLVDSSFKILYQHGVADYLTVKPRFYPDVPGFYKFDLIVFDGELVSAPAITVVNVLASAIPRGVIPNLSFFWDYLSNFWSLVDNKQRIDTFWSASAQIVASELLNLWQIDYSKSLRDIQRSIQRRWLHYTLKTEETQVDLTSIRVVNEKLDSDEFVNGDPVDGVVTLSWPGGTKTITLTSGTVDAVALALGTALRGTPLTLTVVNVWTTSKKQLRVLGLDVRVTSSTSSLFTTNQASTANSGTGAFLVKPKTFRVDASLQGLGLKEDDLFVNGEVTYRVVRVVDDTSDDYSYARVVVKEDIPVDAPANWAVVSKVTSTQIDFWENLFDAGDDLVLEVVETATDTVTYVRGSVMGVCSGLPKSAGAELSSLHSYLLQPSLYEVRLSSAVHLAYLPVDDLVVDIPFLQQKIAVSPEAEVLHRNVDYFLETFRGKNAIRFDQRVWDDEEIPDRLWAEFTYLDNRPQIDANFGVPAGFTLDQLDDIGANLDYLSAVRGLWYAYLNGPTVENIKIGTQILLGLPFAEAAGTIEEIRTDFSPTQGRILVRDGEATEVVRSYTFPVSLPVATSPVTGLPYVVGDSVELFAPLVDGVEVLDYESDPEWFSGYLSQGVFLEIEKFFKFVVRVDSAAFNLTTLLFAKSFVQRIKPTYTYGIFVVRKQVDAAEISVTDTITFTVHVDLFDGAWTDPAGEVTMFDDPRAGGNTDVDGGLRWRNRFDENNDPDDAAPTPPTPDEVTWAFDQDSLSPSSQITATICEDFTGSDPLTGIPWGDPFTPPFESIFGFDSPVYLASDTLFASPIDWDFDTPLTADVYCVRLVISP